MIESQKMASLVDLGQGRGGVGRRLILDLNTYFFVHLILNYPENSIHRYPKDQGLAK